MQLEQLSGLPSGHVRWRGQYAELQPPSARTSRLLRRSSWTAPCGGCQSGSSPESWPVITFNPPQGIKMTLRQRSELHSSRRAQKSYVPEDGLAFSCSKVEYPIIDAFLVLRVHHPFKAPTRLDHAVAELGETAGPFSAAQ